MNCSWTEKVDRWNTLWQGVDNIYCGKQNSLPFTSEEISLLLQENSERLHSMNPHNISRLQFAIQQVYPKHQQEDLIKKMNYLGLNTLQTLPLEPLQQIVSLLPLSSL